MSLRPFKIEQIALHIPLSTNRDQAMRILSVLGMTDWVFDKVTAEGSVFDSEPGVNEAELRFNYQSGNGADGDAGKPLELEIIHYTAGHNWLHWRDSGVPFGDSEVSHIGMHCTAEELEQYREFFKSEGIRVAQDVLTKAHTNDHIKDSRRYNYVIFDTHKVIGVDLKFIVRIDINKAD